MTFTLREIEACTGGRLIGGDPAAQVFSITTDSRTLSPGELFVALKGEHFDGHAFLEVAAASGAGAALVSEAPAISGLPLIVVNDTLKALGDIAAHIRDTLNPTVVGITGSTGKTTVKELCASILQLGGKCLKTAKNFNNLVGLPLNLLRLEPDHRFCVLEMGSSCPGEIRRLSHIARPEASVITNINPAHLNGLGSIEGIIREKQDIFCHTSRVAVINPSLEHMRQLTIPAGLDVVTFSAEAPADVCLAEIHAQGLNGTELSLDIAGQVIRTRLRLPGRHNVLNALAAAALAHALGLDHQSIAAGLRQAKGPHMRSEIIVLDHLTLINDSYNASPASMQAGLAMLKEAPYTSKVAILGDMLELGKDARYWHEQLGRSIAQAGIDQLIITGSMAEVVIASAMDAGMSGEAIHQAASIDEMKPLLSELLPADAIVLVKASRALGLDRVVDYLKAVA